MNTKLNKWSARITEDKSQGASQAMLLATGLKKQDLLKPFIGIASMWIERNPCNMHLLDLSKEVEKGVEKADLVGMRFNTIGVSDGISMGTEGMRYSLPSRDLIADSIETVVNGLWYDACIVIPGCDKNMPGSLIALARINRPGLMVYGGTIRSGCSRGKPVDIVSAFQSYGKFLRHEIDDEERQDIIEHACPGAGACGGMYTANTMASAIEAMGMTLPYSSSTPATDPKKITECRLVGSVVKEMLKSDLKPSDIMTKEAFENALVLITALGGSTNAVIHLIAIADAIGVPLGIDDFQSVSERIPLLADLKPSGRYVMEDLHNVGGIPAVLKMLLREGLVHGDCLTVTGRTLKENLEGLPDLTLGQNIITSLQSPIYPRGHLRILKGNLAPEGAVAKITGKEGEYFSGPAAVYDSEDELMAALEQGNIKGGEVIVIRYVGPKGGPGMPEMLKPTSTIMGMGLGKKVALITDGRFSGGSHGFIIGHITPEAQVGGPIALIRKGDIISIDAKKCTIEVAITDKEIHSRRQDWCEPPLKTKNGILRRYAMCTSTASKGCIETF